MKENAKYQIHNKSFKQKNTRIVSLDILRGICALMIMFYHLDLWTSTDTRSFDNILYKFGRHGVSMFYVLSGFALAIVYKNKLVNLAAILSFYKKRIFRIYPLMILTQVLTIAGIYIIGRNSLPSLYHVLLNFTGLFGLIDNSSAIATGSWSIGNEICFYLFFPILMNIFYSKNKLRIIILFISLVLIYYYFNFILLTDTKSLSSQWSIYINTFNQFPLFVVGILLGISHSKNIFRLKTVLATLLLILSVLFFLFLKTPDSDISIVSGYLKIIFIVLIVFIIWSLKSLEHFFKRKLLIKPFVFLGDISYSVYLLHPIIYGFMNLLKNDLSRPQFLITTALLTLLVSYFVFNFFEKKFVEFGRKK